MSRRHNPRMSTVRKEELTFGHRQCVKPDQVSKKNKEKRSTTLVFRLFYVCVLSTFAHPKAVVTRNNTVHTNVSKPSLSFCVFAHSPLFSPREDTPSKRYPCPQR